MTQTPSSPPARTAVEQIREHIRSRYCRPEHHGARIPPEREFMRRFSVSRPTVRSAMSNLVSDGYLRRFPGKGTFVVDPQRADTPVPVKDATISLVCRTLMRHEGAAWVTAALDRLFEYNAVGVTNHTRADTFREFELLRQALQREMDGLVLHSSVAAQPEPTMLNAVRELQLTARMPVVLIGESPLFTDATSVWVDEPALGRLATEHLIELGHQRIAHLSFERQVPGRTEGYRQALADAGLSVPSDYVLDISTVPHEDKTVQVGRNAAKILLSLDEPPTAVFVYWVECAVGIVQEAQKQGLRVPEDLAVIGAGDGLDEPARSQAPMPMSYVGMDMAAIGRRTIDELMRELSGQQGGQSIRVAPELYAAESTRGKAST